MSVRHLVEHGHRDIAFACDMTPWNNHQEDFEDYRKVCLQFNLKSSASTIWKVDLEIETEARSTLIKYHKEYPDVTAILAHDRLAVHAMKTFQVPKNLSVISLYGPQDSAATTVELRNTEHTVYLWTCTQLIAQIQNLQSGLPAVPPFHTLFVPDLIDRGTTRTLPQKTNLAEKIRSHENARQSPWDSWRKTYPFCKNSNSNNWVQIDLTHLTNHSMTKEHGWLGKDPLLHFRPGQRSMHGVPFQVIDERHNEGCAVVTFRSPRTHTTGQKKLPTKVNIPIGRCVRALYFLHGCGFARPVPFAKYTMHFKNGKSANIPLIPIGSSLAQARKQLGKLKPNIQDWWLGFEQQDFPHAKYATVYDPANPTEYERTLYTLEWINPDPQEEVSHIEIRVDPKAGPTLALIAVTALL